MQPPHRDGDARQQHRERVQARQQSEAVRGVEAAPAGRRAEATRAQQRVDQRQHDEDHDVDQDEHPVLAAARASGEIDVLLEDLDVPAHSDPPRPVEVLLGQMDVLVVHGLVVDALHRGSDPGGHLPGLVDRAHERAHVGLVALARQPAVAVRLPHVRADELARGRDVVAREQPDVPVEPDVRQREPAVDPGVLQHAVPALHPGLAVGHVLGAQVVVERDQRRDLARW